MANRSENRKHQSMEAGGCEHPDTMEMPTKETKQEVRKLVRPSLTQELKEEMRGLHSTIQSAPDFCFWVSLSSWEVGPFPAEKAVPCSGLR